MAPNPAMRDDNKHCEIIRKRCDIEAQILTRKRETVYVHSIRTVRSYSLLSALLNQLKLVYGSFGQSNLHSTLDFFPRPLHKRSQELTVQIYIYIVKAV